MKKFQGFIGPSSGCKQRVIKRWQPGRLNSVSGSKEFEVSVSGG